jgi:NADPH:quinone reductase-like Zn-dependent oxidoreductase
MKAMKVSSAELGQALVAAEIPQPEPGAGELLIRVHAAGVTPTELGWYPTSHTKTGEPRTGAVPGHEFSGVVTSLGKDVAGFEAGQAVYGMNDWFADGATAEFCVALPGSVAAKPATLTHQAAATVPIGALTAWQGLLERAKIQPGERVVVLGGAGAVGMFAVQLAHLHGACVIATASARDLDFAKQLGADEAIDYRTNNLEREKNRADVVFDAVGGKTLDDAWSLLKPGGRMVTIASDSEATTEQRVKAAFFIVEPNQTQLAAIAELLDAGTLKTSINTVVPLEEASNAYSGSARNRNAHGKMVVAVSP